MTAMKV